MNTQLFSDESPIPKRANQRKKNEVYEFVRNTWFEGSDAKCIAARIGKLSRNFSELCGDCTPDEVIAEIKRRRGVYQRTWKEMTETPEALFKHWSLMKSETDKLEKNMNAQMRADLRKAEMKMQEYKGVISNPISEAQRAGAIKSYKAYVQSLGVMAQDNAIRNIITDIRVML